MFVFCTVWIARKFSLKLLSSRIYIHVSSLYHWNHYQDSFSTDMNSRVTIASKKSTSAISEHLRAQGCTGDMTNRHIWLSTTTRLRSLWFVCIAYLCFIVMVVTWQLLAHAGGKILDKVRGNSVRQLKWECTAGMKHRTTGPKHTSQIRRIIGLFLIQS